MRLVVALALVFAVGSLAFSQEPGQEQEAPNPVVILKTSAGDIEIELWPKAAPKTVENFIGLAEGTKEFKDPETGEMVKRPFYDGLIFHRIIKNFMIQGGCPQGNGRGNPGYRFEDEINATGLGLADKKVLENGRPTQAAMMALNIRDQQGFQAQVVQPLFQKLGIKSQEELDQRRADVQKAMESLTVKQALENIGYKYDDKLEAQQPLKGCIAMANSGPDSNGSQFFINLKDTPWLAGKHTVFGKVVKGMDVVEKLGEVKVGAGAKPVEDVKILSIRVKKAQPADDEG